jgi:hypothetical protein
MATPKRTHTPRNTDDVTDSGIEQQPGALMGSVPESPKSSDEVTADDAVAGSAVAREERSPSSASGLSADDPEAGDARKKAYEDGAILVSRID